MQWGRWYDSNNGSPGDDVERGEPRERCGGKPGAWRGRRRGAWDAIGDRESETERPSLEAHRGGVWGWLPAMAADW